MAADSLSQGERTFASMRSFALWKGVSVAPEFEIRLQGDRARVGEVPAQDVAYTVIGFEQALQVAAAGLWGRPERGTGRRGRTPEEATRLRWASYVKRGSVRIPLALPASDPDEDQLDLTVPTLGEAALGRTLEVLRLVDTDSVDVAQALTRWCSKIGVGQKYIVEVRGPAVEGKVRVDRRVREHLAEVATRPLRDPETGAVAGVLYEANFEDLEARVRSADGTSATVLFDEQHADEIQEALRSPTTIEGDVTVDPVTMGVRSIRLRHVQRPEQLGFHVLERDFTSHKTVAQLAEEQGVPPLSRPEDLPSFEMDDEEYEEFLAAVEG